MQPMKGPNLSLDVHLVQQEGLELAEPDSGVPVLAQPPPALFPDKVTFNLSEPQFP